LAEKTTQTLGYPQKSSVKILPKYARASGTTLVHQLHNPDFFLKFPEPMWLLPRMAAELGNSESTNIPCNSVCIYLSIYLSIYIYIQYYIHIHRYRFSSSNGSCNLFFLGKGKELYVLHLRLAEGFHSPVAT
jgi:hypothetical protein